MTPYAQVRIGVRHIAVLGLYVFAVGGLMYALGLRLSTGASDQTVILATAGGLIAVCAMFVDLCDLWVRGRRLTVRSVRLLRFVAVAAFAAAVVASWLVDYYLALLVMLPGVVIYFSIISPPRKPGQARRVASAQTQASSRTPTKMVGKSRQRRGGRKRR
jgi:hypothetical protein